ncbi:hypothetical protein [Deinococcus pimensis]|uniref:hypothetical protein n=1 Tax=Deinococcus pimensis TaxID=309888 RepID=UPI000481A0A4|nr:hypothetical protein [Deinococcus pimensis]
MALDVPEVAAKVSYAAAGVVPVPSQAYGSPSGRQTTPRVVPVPAAPKALTSALTRGVFLSEMAFRDVSSASTHATEVEFVVERARLVKV